MNWINLNITTLDSEEFLGATPAQRATWLCLLRYCVGQENGGRISDAKPWKDRKWQQVVRVRQREISSGCELWTWHGDDLIVTFYPEDKEAEIKRLREVGKQSSEAKRAAAKSNGTKGGRPKDNPTENRTENPTKNPAETQQKTQAKPIEGERKEKEKGIPPMPPPGVGTPGAIPSDPDHESESEPRVLPDRWRQLSRSDRKNGRVLCNNRSMQRIGIWFGRKPDDLWCLVEGIALSQLHPPKVEIDLLESYYLADIPRDDDIRRRDLLTLLNNWRSELDRARIWQAENPNHARA